MKTLFFFSVLALLSYTVAAQELHFPSGKEKHDAKPARFRALQQNRNFLTDAASLHSLMSAAPQQKITVNIGNGYSFKGTVIEKKQERPEILTLVARSADDPQLLLSLSRVTIEAKPVFRGIILSTSGSDLILLEPNDNGAYAWTVKKVSELLAD